jgi:hypothetical protein
MLDIETLRPFVALMEGEITYDMHSDTYRVHVSLGGGRFATASFGPTDSMDLALLVLADLANTRNEATNG